MPLFEFECPECKERIEEYTSGRIDKRVPLCPKCGQAMMEDVEYSIPAKRNPEHGIQK